MSELKELLITNFIQSTAEFDETKSRLHFLSGRISTLEKKLESAFLSASGETLKQISDYTQLRQAVEDVVSAGEQKLHYQGKYRQIMNRIELVSEVSKVIF